MIRDSDNVGTLDVPPYHLGGPFSTFREWLEAAATLCLNYRNSCATPLVQAQIRDTVNVIRHSEVLRHPESSGSSLRLEHTDFSPQNILISTTEPRKILAVIDWEGARVVPLWAMNPRFRWPDESSEDEIETLRVLMQERMSAKESAWSSAIGEECEVLRSLVDRAYWSTFPLEQLTFPPFLFMSSPQN